MGVINDCIGLLYESRDNADPFDGDKLAPDPEQPPRAFGFTDEEETAGATDEMQHNLVYTGGLQFSLGGTSETIDTDLDGVQDKKAGKHGPFNA
mgnify:CR=1 FL=1